MGSKMNLFANIANSALTEIGTFASDQMRQKQQADQASQMKVQAANIRAQANANARMGQEQAKSLERQKSDITRQYNRLQARNRVNLGAGNVDMTSGSALKIQEGNAEAYAQDMAENKYNVAMKLWDAEQARKNAFYEADQYDAQASYLNRTKGNLLTSLLTAQLAGAQSFLGGMGMPTSGLASIGGMLPGANGQGGTTGVNMAAFNNMFGTGQKSSVQTDLTNPVGQYYHRNVKANWVSKLR